MLPRNDQKLLYLTVTKLLVIMTKTNEKEKEIITAKSFDEHKLVITSFVAKRNVYSEYWREYLIQVQFL